MKTILAAALALILGLFLGGMPLRSELRKTKAELSAAKLEAEAAREAGAGQGAGALPMLGLSSLLAAREQQISAEEQAARVPQFVVPDAGAAAAAGERSGGDAGADGRRRRGFNLKDLPEVRAAAALRAAQFRSAFLEEAHLSPGQEAEVDAVVKSLNDEVAKAADELAETFRTRGKKLGTRDMIDVGAKMLDIYRRSDDRLNGVLDANAQAAKEKTRFDLTNQLDIGGLGNLAEAMETLGVAEFGRRR
jgi:hypothetical protein